MRAFLPLLFWLIVAMGSSGMEALSQITGLEIVEGTYDFQADHIMVRAWGRSSIGLTWQVKVRCYE